MTRNLYKCVLISSFAAVLATWGIVRLSHDARLAAAEEKAIDKAAPAKEASAKLSEGGATDDALPIDPVASQIQPGDWNQWCGSPARDNTPTGKNMPTTWKAGEIDSDTGDWKKETSQNIKWAARLGSQTYPSPIVANGKVFIGTNNGSGYLKRPAASTDLGVLLCFNEADGKFLWQDSSEKLPATGRVNDWPLLGICSTPLAEGHRLWYVTSRGEVKCLDTEERKAGTTDEPKVLWTFDMMKTLAVYQHNMAACSVTDAGDLLFVTTGNGVDDGHINLPSASAPSFICLDKNTGDVIWTDNTPGKNVLHGQWSSPSYAVLGGVPQVIFGGGDGYVYSFLGTKENDHGHPKLLWKFDCNPKESKYVLGSKSDRNHIIGTPTIYKGLIYVGVGEDPEHGEGAGHFWCIDPTKRGDVSPELAFNKSDPEHPINPPHRNQAVVAADGDFTRPNPNSAAVWHYSQYDLNGNGKIDFEEIMHRTCGTAAIKNDLLFIADFSGILHCLDAKTGKPHWAYDMLAACWGSATIVDNKVYIGQEDGDIFIFKLAPKMELLSKKDDGTPGGISMGSAVYSTPIVAQNVLFISNKDYLFAITPSAQVAAASK